MWYVVWHTRNGCIKGNHSNMKDKADVVAAEETHQKKHQGPKKPSILLMKSNMPSMRQNFQEHLLCYQFHRGNLCNKIVKNT